MLVLFCFCKFMDLTIKRTNNDLKKVLYNPMPYIHSCMYCYFRKTKTERNISEIHEKKWVCCQKQSPQNDCYSKYKVSFLLKISWWGPVQPSHRLLSAKVQSSGLETISCSYAPLCSSRLHGIEAGRSSQAEVKFIVRCVAIALWWVWWEERGALVRHTVHYKKIISSKNVSTSLLLTAPQKI